MAGSPRRYSVGLGTSDAAGARPISDGAGSISWQRPMPWGGAVIGPVPLVNMQANYYYLWQDSSPATAYFPSAGVVDGSEIQLLAHNVTGANPIVFDSYGGALLQRPDLAVGPWSTAVFTLVRNLRYQYSSATNTWYLISRVP